MSKTVGIVFALKDNCTPQINKISESLGVSTKEARKMRAEAVALGKELSKGMKNACKIAGGAFLALGGVITLTLNKTREYADRVDDMSKKIGISKKAFQEWEYIIKQNGAEIDVVQRGMKTLVTQSLNVVNGNKESIKSFKKLGISVKDGNGHLKNQETLFGEVIDKLQKMPEGLEKSALATKLLGKAGTELQPLLAENAKTISTLKKEINDLGLVIDDKTIDSANTFSDNILAIQRGFGVMMMSLGNDLIPCLNEVCREVITNMPKIRETVIPLIHNIADGIKFAIENIDKITPVVITCVSAFALFKTVDTAMKMYAIGTAIAKVIPIMHTCKAVQLAMASATKIATVAQAGFNIVMNANPVVLVCSAIAGLIALMVTLELKFKLVTRIANKFKQVSKGIAEQFREQNEKVKASKGGTIPQYASGTSFASGGLSLVGEKGPELVNLPRGSKVLNAGDTLSAMNSKNITVNLNVAGNVIGNGEFINQIKQVLGRELAVALNC